jgi:hypothetical protein
MRGDYPQKIRLEGEHGDEFFRFGEVKSFVIPDMQKVRDHPDGKYLIEYVAGDTIEFGADESHIPVAGETVWQKRRSNWRLSDVQRGFRVLMILHGHDMRARNEDADHVQDLQFVGPDFYTNIWPLDAPINRSNRRFLRQVVTYLDSRDGQVKDSPLSSRAMYWKYFRIAGFRHF